MDEVGSKFEKGEYFVPEMLISARAMKAALTLLKPLLVQQDVETQGMVVVGTVKGDLHDTGKNLVGMMLEGAGFEVFDLGTDVPAEEFVQAAIENHSSLMAQSALLTTTMRKMDSVISELQKAGVRDHVRVMIGSAAVSEDFAREVGADGYAQDAGRAANLARVLVGPDR
jgi:5-methyltetrahydrofolate--homocysteine methyltransferase